MIRTAYLELAAHRVLTADERELLIEDARHAASAHAAATRKPTLLRRLAARVW